MLLRDQETDEVGAASVVTARDAVRLDIARDGTPDGRNRRVEVTIR